MPTSINLAGLAQQIQSLLSERRTHEQAIETIDRTLEQVQRVLGRSGSGGGASGNGRARRGRPPGSSSAASQGQGRRRRRRRGRFATSGADAVLAFVQKHRNPTTREVNQFWKGEGRGGTADNTLTLLTKNKQLKRSALEGERGSRYQIA